MTRLRMLGLLAALAVAAAMIGSSTRPAQAAGPDGGQLLFPNLPTQSPILVYDVTGGTLAGVIHFRMTVYNSGFASVSEAGFNVFDPNDDKGCPSDGRATYDFVGLDVAQELQTALLNAGAFQATNGQQGVDVPLHTVTVFKGRGAQSKAHSFVFQFASSDEIFATMEVINAFIDEHFPGY